MKKSWSVAIIGAGQIAGGYDQRKHSSGVFTHAGAYQKNGNFEVRTVVDKDLSKARSFSEVWKVPTSSSDLKLILDQFHDVVSVCTPNSTHFEITESLLLARCCSVVFLEKPAADDSEKIKKLIGLSEKQKIPVVINFQRHFDSSLGELRNSVTQGKETPLAISGHFVRGLQNIGSSWIDMVLFCTGDWPEKVLSLPSRVSQQLPNNQEPSFDFILDFQKLRATATALDSFPEGHRAPYIFELDLFFENRRLRWLENSRLWQESHRGDYPAYPGVEIYLDRTAEMRGSEYDLCLLRAVEHLQKILETGELSTPHGLTNALRVQKIVDALKESQKTKTWVTLPPLNTD